MSGNDNDFTPDGNSENLIYNSTGFEKGSISIPDNETHNYLGNSSISTFPTDEITAFMVIRSEDENGGILSYASSETGNDFLLFYSSQLRIDINNSIENTAITFHDNTPHIIAITWKSSTGQLNVYKNGTNQHSEIHEKDTVMTSGGQLALSGDQDTVSGGGFDTSQVYGQELGEIIIFNTALTDVQVDQVTHTLAKKWGIETAENTIEEKYPFIDINDISPLPKAITKIAKLTVTKTARTRNGWKVVFDYCSNFDHQAP